MIDILIRAYNESIWLPQLFRSLINQKGNKIRNILLLDNNSNGNNSTSTSTNTNTRKNSSN